MMHTVLFSFARLSQFLPIPVPRSPKRFKDERDALREPDFQYKPHTYNTIYSLHHAIQLNIKRLSSINLSHHSDSPTHTVTSLHDSILQGPSNPQHCSSRIEQGHRWWQSPCPSLQAQFELVHSTTHFRILFIFRQQIPYDNQ
ncbi:MAG: hypothetical protein CL912_09635 [Deltaproteobacteria bacterium]|nr:hypothetical protein [Deltaproteobacteria bacterium]